MKIGFFLPFIAAVILCLMVFSCELKETGNPGLSVSSLNDLGIDIGKKWKNIQSTDLANSTTVGITDYAGLTDPVVIKRGNTYMMWYSAKSKEGIWRVCYATSYDGLKWNREYNNIVLSESEFGLDSGGLRVCSVIYQESNNKYRMWCRAFKKIDETYKSCNIIYAYSNSPNKDWTKLPNNDTPSSVLKITDKYNENICGELGKVAVIQTKYMDGNLPVYEYRLWYVKDVNENDNINKPQIFYIFSPNEYEFQIRNTNPPDIFAKSAAPNAFFKEGFCMPTVIRDYYEGELIYKLWFATLSKSNKRSLGFGYGINGFDFDDYEQPVFNSAGISADTKEFINPCIIRDGDKYKMWYAGIGDDDRYRICYAESTNN
jgi:hypothetical protein